MTEAITIHFRYTEEEYLAAARLSFIRSSEVLVRLAVSYLLVVGGLSALLVAGNISLPLWSIFVMALLIGLSFVYSIFVKAPRRYFRGDPKFRDEYTLTFTATGIRGQTQHLNSQLAWSFYSEAIEHKDFFSLIYGKGINTITIVPKRAFQNRAQEIAFREMLRIQFPQSLMAKQLSENAPAVGEYVPLSHEPPDWR